MLKMKKRLYKNTKKGMIFGVCQGIAEYFELDSTLIRILWVIFTLFSGLFPGVIFYLILALIVPEKEKIEPKKTDQKEENSAEKSPSSSAYKKGQLIFGLVLVFLGFLFLLTNFDLIPWFTFSKLWPLILILIGFTLLLKKNGLSKKQ